MPWCANSLIPRPQKSTISEVAPVVPIEAESLTEVGEILQCALGESTISSGKSPIAEVAKDVATTKLSTTIKRRNR